MPRAYHSPRRQADAAATRAEIIDAAGRLFVRDGYVSSSQRAIAAEVGVSLPTVQLQGPKHRLLIAAFERAFAGDEGRQPLAARPAMAAIMAEPESAVAIRRYVDFLIDANRRSASIVRAMMAAADADPAVRAAYEDLEARRMRDMALAAEWFAARDLIDAASVATATDILSHVTAPDTYVHFIRRRGWSDLRYGAWISHQLHHLRELCAFEE